MTSSVERQAIRNTMHIDEQTGKTFENNCYETMFRALCYRNAANEPYRVRPEIQKQLNSPLRRFKKVTNTDLDTKQGTDYIYNDIHIDATLKFSEKDNMPLVYKPTVPILKTKWCDKPLMFGIRIGNTHNGYKDFDKPVVVIGFDMDPKTYDEHKTEILREIANKTPRIINIAEKCMKEFENGEKGIMSKNRNDAKDARKRKGRTKYQELLDMREKMRRNEHVAKETEHGDKQDRIFDDP